MTERVLPYNRDLVPQETGYWCGPASTQTVLQSRGIVVAERDLAREIGTTVNGTDFVGLIERVLDQRVPEARYTVVDVPDYLDEAGKARVWDTFLRSLNAGWGVVVNIVAPPNNYPRGVKGSPNPSYGGGTVYHYVPVMGYDDRERAVWIADSGFRPFGYWCSFDQLCTLMVPKGYAYADLVGEWVEPQVDDAQTVETLSRAMGNAVPIQRYQTLLPYVADALAQSDCTNLARVAMWCAQIGHESGGLRWMEEIADGSAYEGRRDLGNMYEGDGPRFKGRGPIQVTGRANYAALSAWAYGGGLVPSATFFTDQPLLLATDQYAFLGAIWYWTVARPMNDYADRGDIEGATRAVNGGLNGLYDRRERWQRCIQQGNALLALTSVEDWAPVLAELLGT